MEETTKGFALDLRKKPFGHPVPAEAIPLFCHPRPGHRFHKPAWGRDGKLYCSTGWVTVRFYNFTSAFGESPQTMVEELKKILGPLPGAGGAGWRNLDKVRGEIYSKHPLVVPWRDERGGYRIYPIVRFNHSMMLPLASLQLVSRLPRPEISDATYKRKAGLTGDPVSFRFNGGDGVMWTLSDKQAFADTAEALVVADIFAQRFEDGSR